MPLTAGFVYSLDSNVNKYARLREVWHFYTCSISATGEELLNQPALYLSRYFHSFSDVDKGPLVGMPIAHVPTDLRQFQSKTFEGFQHANYRSRRFEGKGRVCQ